MYGILREISVNTLGCSQISHHFIQAAGLLTLVTSDSCLCAHRTSTAAIITGTLGQLDMHHQRYQRARYRGHQL